MIDLHHYLHCLHLIYPNINNIIRTNIMLFWKRITCWLTDIVIVLLLIICSPDTMILEQTTLVVYYQYCRPTVDCFARPIRNTPQVYIYTHVTPSIVHFIRRKMTVWNDVLKPMHNHQLNIHAALIGCRDQSLVGFQNIPGRLCGYV